MPTFADTIQDGQRGAVPSPLGVTKLQHKGQLISECLFGVLNFPKNQRKI